MSRCSAASGIDVQWLDGADAERLAPGLKAEGVVGATFCQQDGIADPNGVTMGFAKAAQAAGVTVERDTEVTGIRVEAGRVAAVETARGTIETRTVVNAAGPYARQIGRMAGVDVPGRSVSPSHFHRAAPTRTTNDERSNDERSAVGSSAVSRHGD